MITDKKEFDNIIDAQLVNCRDILNEKFKEYQSGDDMLSNFNNIANMLDIEPITAWMGLWAKHVESIITLIQRGKNWPDSHWNEKITDCINYLLLLQCILRQQKNVKTVDSDIKHITEITDKEQQEKVEEILGMEVGPYWKDIPPEIPTGKFQKGRSLSRCPMRR